MTIREFFHDLIHGVGPENRPKQPEEYILEETRIPYEVQKIAYDAGVPERLLIQWWAEVHDKPVSTTNYYNMMEVATAARWKVEDYTNE